MKNPYLKTFPLLYWGPISYFAELVKQELAIYEIWETFPRHSFRNKTTIMGANGPVDLSVPLKKPQGSKTKTKDIEINCDENWQDIHWRSIVSAYSKAPFFEFYADDIKKLIYGNNKSLAQLNININEWTLKKLQVDTKQETTKKFELESAKQLGRFNQRSEKLTSYHQVFEDRHQFEPDLSIIDGIMNLGPELRLYLKKI